MFRKKENSTIAPLSPVEQKQAYLNLQAGGEAPLQGFRMKAPEKPKGKSTIAIASQQPSCQNMFWVFWGVFFSLLLYLASHLGEAQFSSVFYLRWKF